jgi:hypothetical protein
MIYPSTVKGAPRRDEKTQLYESGMCVIEERMSECKLLQQGGIQLAVGEHKRCEFNTNN